MDTASIAFVAAILAFGLAVGSFLSGGGRYEFVATGEHAGYRLDRLSGEVVFCTFNRCVALE